MELGQQHKREKNWFDLPRWHRTRRRKLRAATSAPEVRGEERRVHPRHERCVEVLMTGPDGKRVHGFTRDLSLGGMYIESPRSWPFGTVLEVWMALPGLPEGATVTATVRWSKEGGMGLQFGLMGARETHALVAVLK